MSIDPKKRLKQIQSDFPDTILEHTIKCDDMREAEKRLHEHYSGLRKDGEWFSLGANDVRDIHRQIAYQDGTFLEYSTFQSTTEL